MLKWGIFNASVLVNELGHPPFLFQNWSSHMINIQWTKFERKSIATFISGELPWGHYTDTCFFSLVFAVFLKRTNIDLIRENLSLKKRVTRKENYLKITFLKKKEITNKLRGAKCATTKLKNQLKEKIKVVNTKYSRLHFGLSVIWGAGCLVAHRASCCNNPDGWWQRH